LNQHPARQNSKKLPVYDFLDPQVIKVNRECTRMNANHDRQTERAPNDPRPGPVVENPEEQPWLTVIRVDWRPFAVSPKRKAMQQTSLFL
jgi:hypothetical protein